MARQGIPSAAGARRLTLIFAAIGAVCDLVRVALDLGRSGGWWG